MQKRILCLVLAADCENYDLMVKAIRETWGSAADDSFQVLYYYGQRDDFPRPEAGRVLRTGDVLVVGVEESLQLILKKTLLALDYVRSNFSFDYVFRCCCGSYVDKREALAFVADKPATRFYCGYINSHHGFPYASGSGYFLSRDMVDLLAGNAARIEGYGDPGHWDDVSVGRFLSEAGIPVDPSARITSDSTEVERGQYHYHFRKNVAFMHDIHSKLSRRQP